MGCMVIRFSHNYKQHHNSFTCGFHIDSSIKIPGALVRDEVRKQFKEVILNEKDVCHGQWVANAQPATSSDDTSK